MRGVGTPWIAGVGSVWGIDLARLLADTIVLLKWSVLFMMAFTWSGGVRRDSRVSWGSLGLATRISLHAY